MVPPMGDASFDQADRRYVGSQIRVRRVASCLQGPACHGCLGCDGLSPSPTLEGQ